MLPGAQLYELRWKGWPWPLWLSSKLVCPLHLNRTLLIGYCFSLHRHPTSNGGLAQLCWKILDRLSPDFMTRLLGTQDWLPTDVPPPWELSAHQSTCILWDSLQPSVHCAQPISVSQYSFLSKLRLGMSYQVQSLTLLPLVLLSESQNRETQLHFLSATFQCNAKHFRYLFTQHRSRLVVQDFNC